MLDATKLIPEEDVPVKIVGRLVLDRPVDNAFAETELVAVCPQNIIPGIDFSNDPLLQGRTFSYHDTQQHRLGTTNFNQFEINAPRCPMHNFSQDGFTRAANQPKGRINYEPNSWGGARENPSLGYHSYAEPLEGTKSVFVLKSLRTIIAKHASSILAKPIPNNCILPMPLCLS